jgi:hypothetical protein
MPQKVFVAQHHADAHLLCGLLQSEGIEAEVRREFLFTTMEASTVIPGMQPEVWILELSKLPQALPIVEFFATRDGVRKDDQPGWECLGCGELHDAQFTQCWRCGIARPLEGPDSGQSNRAQGSSG